MLYYHFLTFFYLFSLLPVILGQWDCEGSWIYYLSHPFSCWGKARPPHYVSSWMKGHKLIKSGDLRVGDLIEFQRNGYEHWAVYTGPLTKENGLVQNIIHFSTPHGDFGGDRNPEKAIKQPAYSLLGKVKQLVGWVNASVIRSNLKDAARNSPIRINNHMDEAFTPDEQDEIVKRAVSELGRSNYYLLTNNCEHFARYCRCGFWQSLQVEVAKKKFTPFAVLSVFLFFILYLYRQRWNGNISLKIFTILGLSLLIWGTYVSHITQEPLSWPVFILYYVVYIVATFFSLFMLLTFHFQRTENNYVFSAYCVSYIPCLWIFWIFYKLKTRNPAPLGLSSCVAWKIDQMSAFCPKP